MPGTIARHYSEGRYCDFPADVVLSAVNSRALSYNPTAIPIRLGFEQSFIANFNAFVYLCEHRSEDELRLFLSDPDGFMLNGGVELLCPFDGFAPLIFAAMVEDDMLEALKSDDDMAVCRLVHSSDKGSWPNRHPERYPQEYMKRKCFYGLKDIPYLMNDKRAVDNGFNKDLSINILSIIRHFSEK